MNKEVQDILRKAIKEEDVAFLCEYFFKWTLTEGQEEIVRTIAFSKHKRISINAYTRYGKTRCVALGISLYILFNKNKKIVLIAPRDEQTDIVKNYLIEHIYACPQLYELSDIDKSGSRRKMITQASRKRLTFKNGCEYRVFSAEGEAFRVMGFGGDIVIKDEAADIKRSASAKISRMLGDDPEGAILIEITNPWDADTLAYDHWINPNWKCIHIGWRQGVAEGRTTEKFVMEQKEELTPLQFTVLYESNYPAQAEDALIMKEWIDASLVRDFSNERNTNLMLGCDIAEAGIDWTVIDNVSKTVNGNYVLHDIYDWHQADTMITSEDIAIISLDRKSNQIKVDAIGVGKGVFDDLSKRRSSGKITANVIPIKVGNSPLLKRDKELYANQKAQFYWFLRKLFEDGRISLKPIYIQGKPLKDQLRSTRRLITELSLMKYELAPTNKKTRIVDPDKSPDYADSLMLACAEGSAVRIFM